MKEIVVYSAQGIKPKVLVYIAARKTVIVLVPEGALRVIKAETQLAF